MEIRPWLVIPLSRLWQEILAVERSEVEKLQKENAKVEERIQQENKEKKTENKEKKRKQRKEKKTNNNMRSTNCSLEVSPNGTDSSRYRRRRRRFTGGRLSSYFECS